MPSLIFTQFHILSSFWVPSLSPHAFTTKILLYHLASSIHHIIYPQSKNNKSSVHRRVMRCEIWKGEKVFITKFFSTHFYENEESLEICIELKREKRALNEWKWICMKWISHLISIVIIIMKLKTSLIARRVQVAAGWWQLDFKWR